MKRREFLRISTVGTLAVSLPVSAAFAGTPSRLPVIAHPRLMTLIADRRCICEIGFAYRKKFPREDTRSALSSAILENLPTHLADDLLQDRLDQQVRQDFASGRTVRLNGWVLSMTEARQCALYSIFHS